MLALIEEINNTVNAVVWGVPSMVCILGVGLWLTWRTRFLQFRKFFYVLAHTFGSIFERKKAGGGSLTSFQSLCTALAATVGTGNIAGVAGAIALGGPGAIFWMWVSALLGMCTKFAEVTLAVHFRERNDHGDWVGGPMYYIKNGLSTKWRWLAICYSLFGVLAVFGTGNATQVNTITAAIDAALLNFHIVNSAGIPRVNLTIGIIITLLLGIILFGGIKRIGNVTARLVPFMALFYIILGLALVFVHIEKVPAVFAAIFEGAFAPKAVTGGVVGSLLISMRRGISRGIFSNEAGIGTGSIAHACADVSHPVQQGMWGIFEVFADTIIICTLTALVILCSGIPIHYGAAAGAELTIQGFTSTFGGWISALLAVALCCFAFSTTLGWGLYGLRCIEYLFGKKIIKPFIAVYSAVAIIGATVDLGIVWGVADTFNGLMAIPNLIAVFLLSGTVVRLARDYFRK